MTREAARITENNGADDAVNVIFWPRTGQNSLRSSATFWAQFWTRKKNTFKYIQFGGIWRAIGNVVIKRKSVVEVCKCGKVINCFFYGQAFTPAHRNYPQTSIDLGQ